MRRLEDPAAWVANLFRDQAAGNIDFPCVRLTLAKCMGGSVDVLAQLEVSWHDVDCRQQSRGFIIWPADIPEVAEVMAAGARMLVEQSLTASWMAEPE